MSDPDRPSRIQTRFAELRRGGRTGLVTYVTAGDPDLSRSGQILAALDRAGADVLEVGVPFSDPLADGPVVQRATERALAAGSTLSGILDLLEPLRPSVTAPIVLFSYVNPLLRLGIEAFAARAAAVGVDGVLILDLPMEEAGRVREVLRAHGLEMIFLLSPTTTERRLAEAAALASGFVYGISRLGVTGMRDEVAPGAESLVARIRHATELPIALGFGVSRPEHVRQIGQWADAAVVGSALVQQIADHADSPDLLERVESYVHWLKGDGDTRP